MSAPTESTSQQKNLSYSQACDRCRTRKVRCDAKRPRCTPCEKYYQKLKTRAHAQAQMKLKAQLKAGGKVIAGTECAEGEEEKIEVICRYRIPPFGSESDNEDQQKLEQLEERVATLERIITAQDQAAIRGFQEEKRAFASGPSSISSSTRAKGTPYSSSEGLFSEEFFKQFSELDSQMGSAQAAPTPVSIVTSTPSTMTGPLSPFPTAYEFRFPPPLQTNQSSPIGTTNPHSLNEPNPHSQALEYPFPSASSTSFPPTYLKQRPPFYPQQQQQQSEHQHQPRYEAELEETRKAISSSSLIETRREEHDGIEKEQGK